MGLVVSAAALMAPAGASAYPSICDSGADFCFQRPAWADWYSADGSVAFFQTEARLLPEDPPFYREDVYRWTESGIELVTPDRPGGENVTFRGVTADGSKGYLMSYWREPAYGAAPALWEWSAGVLSFVAAGEFDVVGRDGGSAVVIHGDGMPGAGDADDAQDVFVREGGVNTRVSRGAVNGNGDFDARFVGISGDGRFVYFLTDEKLVSYDGDDVQDVYSYDRDTGATAKVSAGSGDFPAEFSGVNEDGAHPLFATTERVTPATDTDDQHDIYDRTASGPVHVSRGQIGGNSPFGGVAIAAKLSDDGSKVFFLSNEQLTTTDPDDLWDLYAREAGVTTQVSQAAPFGSQGGAVNGVGKFHVSPDGQRVFFSSGEPLAQDDDSSEDVFERYQGQTRVITPGWDSVNENHWIARDETVYFDTRFDIVAEDLDSTLLDTYARHPDGSYELLTVSETGDEGHAAPGIRAVSDHGESVFIGVFPDFAEGDEDRAAPFSTFDYIVRRGGDTFLMTPDTEAPDTLVDGPVEGSTVPTSGTELALGRNEGLTGFECSLDGEVFSTCAGYGDESPSYSTGPLSPGPHVFAARAVDSGGNVDPTPAVRSFVAGDAPADDGGDGSGGVKGVVAGPGISVHRVVVPSSGAKLIRKGIRVLASCDHDCRIVVDARVSNGVAIRMRLNSLTFAHGSRRARADDRRWVVASLTRSAKDAIRTYAGGGRFQIIVRAAG